MRTSSRKEVEVAIAGSRSFDNAASRLEPSNPFGSNTTVHSPSGSADATAG